ncbi:DNA-binding protein [Streptomyces sp. NPDC006711]|uniref:DNA-binding protein n=1 Tax=Streptomyces sp. NPDC006711 TaxID=3364762 RepID=UPI003699EBCB
MARPDFPARDGAASGSLTTLARAAVGDLVALDATDGASAAVTAVRALLRRAPELAAAPATLGAADSDLLAALAELSEVAGWILFDAGLNRAAARMNLRALALAERSGDRATARLTLLNHSMLLTHQRRPVAALDAVARVGGPRPLPNLVATLVLVRRAHASALLGCRRDAMAFMARARSRFLDGASRLDPAWSWWIDEPELTGHHGWVLARLHDRDRAIALLHEAATAPGPSYRDLFTAELLAALVRAGAWREAEDLIAALAPRAGGIGSVRTTRGLARTATRLRGHEGAPGNARDAADFLLRSLPPRRRCLPPRPESGNGPAR